MILREPHGRESAAKNAYKTCMILTRLKMEGKMKDGCEDMIFDAFS